MQELYLRAGQAIKKANRVLVICHKKPDGDTLGAAVAMNNILKDLGKEVQIACVDAIPERYFFMNELRRAVREFDYRDYDLIMVLDAGASYMTKYHEIYPGIFSGEVPVVNIDHHASNDNFGTINIVDVNSASATVIIYKMLTFLGLRISPSSATGILCGIYNDTGSLMHGNTTLEVFEITGKMVDAGGKVGLVAQNLFRITPLSTMKAWGKVLERATLNDEGVVVSVVTERDLRDAEANSEDLTGVVDFMNAVPGSRFTVLLNEDEKGNVKGSFRTRRDDVDLAELAGKFGGGGHKKAAGFTMPGRIHQEIRWKVTPPGGAESPVEKTAPAGVLKMPVQLLGNILQIPEVNLG